MRKWLKLANIKLDMLIGRAQNEKQGIANVGNADSSALMTDIRSHYSQFAFGNLIL